MSRNRLSVNRLDDFIAWSETKGWTSEAPKGFYEVARLRKGSSIALVWRREQNDAGTPLTHYTLDKSSEPLFNLWMRERNA